MSDNMESDDRNFSYQVILDIESKNHLQKECGGDPSKLLIGLAGVKYVGEDKFEFFDESNLDELKNLLENAELIIGFNLVGHNGLDYKMLENHGINIEPLLAKTYDIMTVLIRTFGSFKGLSLDNIARNTFDIPKKKSKGANYKLIQSGQIEEVKINLKHELEVIEKLFLRITGGGLINFETSWRLIDEHELPFLNGFPQIGEEIVEPYDFPFAGMRLQIKEIFDKVVECKKCKRSWRIKSICYYGDTMSEKVYCPNCGNILTEVRTSLFGEPISILESQALRLSERTIA
jgi:hypothetical protein